MVNVTVLPIWSPCRIFSRQVLTVSMSHWAPHSDVLFPSALFAELTDLSFSHSPSHPIFAPFICFFLSPLSIFALVQNNTRNCLILTGFHWLPIDKPVSIITAKCVLCVFSCRVCATFWLSKTKNKWRENQSWFVVYSVYYEIFSLKTFNELCTLML